MRPARRSSRFLPLSPRARPAASALRCRLRRFCCCCGATPPAEVPFSGVHAHDRRPPNTVSRLPRDACTPASLARAAAAFARADGVRCWRIPARVRRRRCIPCDLRFTPRRSPAALTAARRSLGHCAAAVRAPAGLPLAWSRAQVHRWFVLQCFSMAGRNIDSSKMLALVAQQSTGFNPTGVPGSASNGSGAEAELSLDDLFSLRRVHARGGRRPLLHASCTRSPALARVLPRETLRLAPHGPHQAAEARAQRRLVWPAVYREGCARGASTLPSRLAALRPAPCLTLAVPARSAGCRVRSRADVCRCLGPSLAQASSAAPRRSSPRQRWARARRAPSAS